MNQYLGEIPEYQTVPQHGCTYGCILLLGADVILDPVGAAYWNKHSQCVAMDGRVLHIGFVSMKMDGCYSLLLIAS